MSGPLDQIELAYTFATYVKRYIENMLLWVVFPILISIPLSRILLTFVMPVIQNTVFVIVSLVVAMGVFYLKLWLIERYDTERSTANLHALKILFWSKSKKLAKLLLRDVEQEVGGKIVDKNKHIIERIRYIWQDYKPFNVLKFTIFYSTVNLANYTFLLLVGWAFFFAGINIGGVDSTIGMSLLFLLGVLMLYVDIKVVTGFKDDLELAEITTKQGKFIGELISENKDHVLLATVEKISELKLPMDLKWRRVEIEIPRKDISIIKRYLFYKNRRGAI